jgi:hypothetical protein
VLRKQIALDLGAVPYVVAGKKWNDPERMNGRDWNERLETGGWVERYGREKTDAIKAPESQLDQSWTPFVVIPDTSTRGLLLTGIDLFLWPIGFLAIGLKFLLRALLILSGHVRGSPEGVGEKGEEEGAPAEEAA